MEVAPDNKLSVREQTFLDNYFEGMPMPEALRKAGFTAKSEFTLKGIASRALRKYDRLKDHREVFNDIGFSPRVMVEQLMNLAMNAKSETAKVQALNIATKCLGMQRESLDIEQGAEVIIMRKHVVPETKRVISVTKE